MNGYLRACSGDQANYKRTCLEELLVLILRQAPLVLFNLDSVLQLVQPEGQS